MLDLFILIFTGGSVQNATAINSTGFNLGTIDQYMILGITMTDEDVGPHSTYRIGTIAEGNNWCSSVDIAEIIAFDKFYLILKTLSLRNHWLSNGD